MIPISAIFHSYKALVNREKGLPLSIAFVLKDRFKLKTFWDILIQDNFTHTIFCSNDAFKLVGQFCSRYMVDAVVVIAAGRVRFINQPLNKDDPHTYLEKPEYFPESMSQPMVQLICVDFRSGKEPFKKLSVYKQIGDKYEFENLIDGVLQPEDEKMVEAIKDGWGGYENRL